MSYRTSKSLRRAKIPGIVFLAVAALLAGGCASTPRSGLYEGNVSAIDQDSPGVAGGTGAAHGNPVVAAAARVTGTPYRYGGHTTRGFDCSGLVFYAYNQAGIAVPRTTGEQRDFAQSVPLDELLPGDVLFFELDARKVSHVAIYAGGGIFIHAPSTGSKVSYASLESEFWRDRLVGAGRFY